MAEYERQMNLNPVDWSTFDTSHVPDYGMTIWFYNNSELGTDRRFHVTGDGSSTVAELDKCAYLEAGVEMSLEVAGATHNIPEAQAYRASDDQLRMSIAWPEIPKQDADTLTISEPSGSFIFWNANGSIDLTTISYTISNVSINEKRVYCRINSTGAFSGLSGPFALIVGGTGGKITLS